MPVDHAHDQAFTDVLRRVPFFRELPVESPQCLSALRAGSITTHRDGETLQRRGDAADLIFLIEGALDIEGRLVTGAARPAYHGAVEMIARHPACADVRARGPTRVFRLPAGAFERLLADCHRLCRQLLRDFADQLTLDLAPKGDLA